MTDENNIYTARFLGFSVYVSNTTCKEEGVLCFRDTIYTRATLPNQMNITCVTHGRYVIYYNNRTSLSYSSEYSQYAHTDLCEVEVYGKLKVDKQLYLNTVNSWHMLKNCFSLVSFLQKEKQILVSCNVVLHVSYKKKKNSIACDETQCIFFFCIKMHQLSNNRVNLLD